MSNKIKLEKACMDAHDVLRRIENEICSTADLRQFEGKKKNLQLEDLFWIRNEVLRVTRKIEEAFNIKRERVPRGQVLPDLSIMMYQRKLRGLQQKAAERRAQKLASVTPLTATQPEPKNP
jgi:hypothetical protein